MERLIIGGIICIFYRYWRNYYVLSPGNSDQRESQSQLRISKLALLFSCNFVGRYLNSLTIRHISSN